MIPGATATSRLLWRRLDAPLLPLAVAALSTLLFLWVQLAHEGSAPGRFVRAGDQFVDPRAVPGGVEVGEGGGYDGQFYYRLALDPLTDERTAFGITFDRPAYRQQRILYPALAWAIARGDPRAVTSALIAINVAALCAIGWLAGRYAQRLGRHAAWGLLIVLYPGFLVTLSRDLTELLEACLALAALLALRGGRPLASSLILSAAAFAKETALLLAVAVVATGIRGMIARRKLEPGPLAFLIPIGLHLAWQLALTARWGRAPLDEGTSSLAAPLLPLFAAAWRNASLRPEEGFIWIALLALVPVSLVVTSLSLRGSRATAYEKLAWSAYLGLAVFYEPNIWSNAAGFLRALTDLSLVGALIVLGGARRGGAILLGALLASWVLLAVVRVAV